MSRHINHATRDARSPSLTHRLMTPLAIGAALFVGALSCEDLPRRDYEDFKKRTESLRPEKIDADDQASQFADLRGMWLLRAQLNAGIELGLRVEISADEWPEAIPEDAPPFTFQAKIWLDRQDPKMDTPLVIVEPPPQINSEGRFTLTADPLILDAETLGLAVDIKAVVDLNSVSVNADQFCGLATGDVTEPFTIDLEGSTFNALRDDEGLLTVEDIEEVACPQEQAAGEMAGEMAGEAAGESAGESAGDVAGELAGESAGEVAGEVVEPQKPDLPSLEREGSAPADITGHWYLNVSLAGGLSLPLWASLVYTPPPAEGVTEGAEGGVIDGALRRADDPLDAAPLARFTAPINADGVFEVWLPNFTLEGDLSVEGDLLIGGVIIPNEDPAQTYWCGEAAGEARRPIPLPLNGTTLYATPWVPGTPAPTDPLSACP